MDVLTQAAPRTPGSHEAAARTSNSRQCLIILVVCPHTSTNINEAGYREPFSQARCARLKEVSRSRARDTDAGADKTTRRNTNKKNDLRKFSNHRWLTIILYVCMSERAKREAHRKDKGQGKINKRKRSASRSHRSKASGWPLQLAVRTEHTELG